MDRKETVRTSGCIINTILILVQIAFAVLKFTGTVEWSWWITLIPLWGIIGIQIIALLLIGIGVLLIVIGKWIDD